ncbi:hypothetical protein HD_0727 [[Haemophilus] ducreyi 35000HP]|uniref:Uncharacterized protein n=1 Tax=Haemophilus ducreyi (strain 35000HP / ATCC 700724) TaxID=233412 RepID=Q7VN55_HAEDU|nr:hypothetical protein HD_0727 [[Haemophilus] ducreyi 35000HP]
MCLSLYKKARGEISRLHIMLVKRSIYCKISPLILMIEVS